MDFGIAKARMQRNFNTAPGVVKGKYLFFSPEQARGEVVDGRTDVWATGIVLYEMVCGRLPAEGPEYAVLPKLINGAVPRPSELRPDLPAELEALIMKALALNKAHRYESSHAFGDALTGYLYSTTPRFSPLSLSHFVQELFREDLGSEGRVVQVPASFTEELAQWRTPITAPSAAQAPVTQPDAQPEVIPAPREETAPVELESFRHTRVSSQRRLSRQRPVLRSVAIVTGALAVAAGAALAVLKLGPDTLIPKWARSRFVPSPEAPPPMALTGIQNPASADPSSGANGDKPAQNPAQPPKEDGPEA